MKTTLVILILGLFFVWSWQKTTLLDGFKKKPAPVAVIEEPVIEAPAPPAAPAPAIAPPKAEEPAPIDPSPIAAPPAPVSWYLVNRVSQVTDEGIVGIPAGSKVEIEDVGGEMWVSSGKVRLKTTRTNLTNDKPAVEMVAYVPPDPALGKPAPAPSVPSDDAVKQANLEQWKAQARATIAGIEATIAANVKRIKELRDDERKAKAAGRIPGQGAVISRLEAENARLESQKAQLESRL